MNLSRGNNNDKTCEDTKTCKPRFKGVETFLRRIAFNLGNSPSQTEVKIISCIPIDVTDLQNKIISLERQLLEATNSKSLPKKTSVHTVLTESNKRHTNAVLSCTCSEVSPLALGATKENTRMTSQCKEDALKRRNSAVFELPSLSNTRLQQTPFTTNDNWDEKQSLDSNVDRHHKTFFRRCKKKKQMKKKEKPKTQLVYYAQTESSPFNNYIMSTDIPFINYSKPKVDDAFSKTYLTNVLNRHFSPECVVEEFSDTSHFTSPVCRDVYSNGHCPYESDLCSCCHGQFQDVDKYMGKNQNFIIEPMTAHRHSQFNKDVYNDSTLYDIVPVREKTTNALHDEKISLKEPQRSVDIRCWAEIARSKPRYQTTAVYHQTKSRTKYNNYKKRTSNFRGTEVNTITQPPKRYREHQVDKTTGHTDTSNSCHVDCSEIYPKPVLIKQKDVKCETVPPRPIFGKNAECLTIDLDTTNLTITRSIQIDINSTETKTEETLNQIKSILQSVLAEVKTNPQVNNVPEAKSKKDAVIQKGPSQSNMQTCSSLLHSFTYNNSYNVDPCMPSCSRQPPSHLCYANVPFQRPNYAQNFPLLIQTPGHPKCGCFFQNSSHRSTKQKQAATTATNTEIDKEETPGRETDKLIKEIYKSIALTLESPKDTSNSEYDELKSVTHNSTNTSCPKDFQRTIMAMTETSKRDIQTERSITPISTTTDRSTYENKLSNTKAYAKWKKTDHYLDYDSPSTEHENLEAPNPEPNRGMATIASTISEHYSEELSSNGESEGDEDTQDKLKEKMEKKGLFKRMLGSVKIFNKKKQNNRKGSLKQEVDHIDDDKSESDSDDYQTIYSEKIHKPQHLKKSHHYKPKSYVPYRQTQQKADYQRMRSNRRSPYMEQEYRRQWNEQLMFQDGRTRRYSSERPYSVQQTPVYWQNYEARSAMVDNSGPYQASYNPVHPAGVPMRTVIHKIEKTTSPLSIANRRDGKAKFSWLKKPKLGMTQCGEQWKKFILEN